MGMRPTGAPPPSKTRRQARLGHKRGHLLPLYLALLKKKKSQLSIKCSGISLASFRNWRQEDNLKVVSLSCLTQPLKMHFKPKHQIGHVALTVTFTWRR